MLVQAQILNLLLRLRETHGIVEDGSTEQVFAAPRHAYARSLLAAVPQDRISDVSLGG